MYAKLERLIVVLTVAALSAGIAHSQQGGASTPSPQASRNKSGSTPVQNRIETIVAQIARDSGQTILADSTVARAAATPPAAGAVNAQNFEQHLAGLARQVRGLTWAKIYLPTGSYRADDVADFAFAQARLFGAAIGAGGAGEIEILGRKLTMPDADSYVRALNLTPVYLVTNPKARESARAASASNWANLTEEEQKAYASQKANALLNADDAARRHWIQEHQAVFLQLIHSMSPEQRDAMLQGSGMVIRVRSNDGTDIRAGNPVLPPAP